MDPARIRLEDDRFGLIGAAFRPGNRAVYAGRRGDDHVWSIGIIVGPEDDIQTVEIDEHGAKSSRMLTSGEIFEGLDILAAPGAEAYMMAGTFTLMGMELRATSPETTREFADLLRAAADDHNWRLPLRVVGHPRDLQLSDQGRDILRETAATLELDGSATTSLAAARRLELSEQALDSINRRISRASLQAYRMHGRWYVVLDNLARSRTTPSPVEEAPEAEAPPVAEVAAEPEPAAEPSVAPTEDDLAAFAEPEAAEPEEPAAAAPEPEPPAEPMVEYVQEEPHVEAEAPVAADEPAVSEPVEAEPEEPAPAAEAAAEPVIEETAEIEAAAEPVSEEPAAETGVTEEYRAAATVPEPSTRADETMSESVAEAGETVVEAEEAVAEEEAAAPSEEVEQAETAPMEAEQAEAPTIEAEEPVATEAEAEPEPSVEAETAPEIEAEATEAAAEPPVEPAAGIEEPVVAEDLAAVETRTEAGEAGTEAAAEAPEEPAAEPEPTAAEAPDVTEIEEETAEEPSEAPVVEGEPAGEPVTAEAEAQPTAEPDVTEPVQSEEALLFAEMVEQDAEAEPAATELESDIASESDELIAETVSEAAEAAPSEEAEPASAETEMAGEPSDEVIAERIRSHVPPYADDIGRDELIDSGPAPEAEAEAEAEAETASEAAEAEAEPTGGPSGASYFADARRGAGARQEAPRSAELEFTMHLRSEIAFLRQQSREKDRQISIWSEGGKWLQPFVEQIRSLEKQVERLGELHVQRENERINDLIAERDALRQRLESLEAQINAAQTASNAPSETNRRSWFRRLMGSE